MAPLGWPIQLNIDLPVDSHSQLVLSGGAGTVTEPNGESKGCAMAQEPNCFGPSG